MKKELSVNQKLVINLSASFVAYAVTFGINFFLSPYIVQTVGVEAHGFVGLANNFISYATMITIALNALAGRFITIKIHENDYDGANRYYSSVFLSNCIISGVLLVVLSVIWIYLDNLIKIPQNIFWDVKILFAALFLNCLISTIGSVFGVATYATNKLYLGSIRSIESSVIRAVILVAMFSFLAPGVSYLGITSLFTGLYCFFFNIYYTHKLLPFVKIKKSYFDFAAVKELISSGVWNLVTRVGQILTDGLDLLITNLFIDATAMGVLSLAKTIPSMITSIVGTLVGSFSPNFTILYAEHKNDELVAAIKQSMKIMGVIANLPIIVLIVCGQEFFTLWQPTQDARQLVILSFLTCAGLIFNGGINCIYDIFTVVNKLKVSAIVLISASIISTGVVLVLLQTTNLGIYAVAGVSTVIMIIKNIFIIVPYASRCLGLKWYSFYSYVFRPAVFVLISSAINIAIVSRISGIGWPHLFVCAGVTAIVSLIIGMFVILKRAERKILINKIIRK